jgi:hypothetical protein
MPAYPRVRSMSSVFSPIVLLVLALFSGTAFAAPMIVLSKKIGPPTSKILVSGTGFEPNVGVDIFFDTKDEMLVVTNTNKQTWARWANPDGTRHPERWIQKIIANKPAKANSSADAFVHVFARDVPAAGQRVVAQLAQL